MTKFYKLVKLNRFEDIYEETFYANKKNAEQEKEEILNKYNKAKKQGSGSHWASVIYSTAWIETIKTAD